ncbi:MAG TPA: cobalamin-dependent protein [candidate division Zixibacteria bacterium]|nr:cobalamin-dependent protein [candidate division Zixibacteria bacterium]
MKLLFITPPMGNWAPWGDRHLAVNSLHAQLAAFVREKGTAEVEALDCRALGLGESEMLEEVRRRGPDVVFFGSMIPAAGGAAQLNRFHAAMKAIKEIRPGTVTVGGGLMYTAIPQQIMRDNPQLDFALTGVFGDNEHALEELLQELGGPSPRLAEIRGLAFRRGDEIVLNPQRPLIQNLDELPMPAYDLFPMDRYCGYSVIPNYNEAVTSRGCEGACHFCYEWWLVDPRNPRDFSSHRTRGGRKVADEMELLNRTYGVKALTFMDDDFNSDRQKMVDLVNELEKRRLDISWFCLSRAQNLIRDADLIPRLRRVGLYQVLIGIDGGTDEEIAEARKGPMKVGVKELKDLIRFLRKNDISTIATYLNGFWEDDEAKIRQRARAVDEIDPDIVMIQLLNPIPGSPIYKKAVKENLIEVDNLSLYDLEHCVMPTKYLTRQQLAELTGWAFQSFYAKPGRVERILNGYTSPYVKMKFLSFKGNAAKYGKGAAEDAVAI